MKEKKQKWGGDIVIVQDGIDDGDTYAREKDMDGIQG